MHTLRVNETKLNLRDAFILGRFALGGVRESKFDERTIFLGDCRNLTCLLRKLNLIDTVDHSILIKKLKLYGVKGNNLRWFESYLSSRKEYISYNSNKFTAFESITYGVPQGSILGPLLFLIYINDLPNATNILDPIMFADDTNLFYSHRGIKTLFPTVNEELEKLGGWFTANRLSLIIQKTKYTFFHENSVNDNLSLKLLDLHISNKSIERKSLINF